MGAMQRLRIARFLARFVLAWFALVIAAAAATPVIQPQALDLICSGGGMKLVAAGGLDEGQPRAATSLDCPLCLAVAPPPAVMPPVRPQPIERAPQSIPSERPIALLAAALPARGPPSLFA
jgi:hypothetical protein